MIARAVEVTPCGALNLIRELGVREATGRGRIVLGVFCSAPRIEHIGPLPISPI
ncbi:helix-turn-helix domain-containing protein [Castellaniella sp.]|uniref:helix-turn-helix domain-containing protein n=1 Tax=Castellaniella sp. TaxID=1955812 RepID=UPI003A599C3F